MKKILLALATVFVGLASYSASAQNVVERGTNVVNLGVGLNSANSYNLFTVVGSWDYGVVGNLWDANSALTLGAQGAFSTSSHMNAFSIGPTVGLHYHFIPQLDTYLRLMLGYSNWMYKDRDLNDAAKAVGVRNSDGGFGWNLALGTRYMFTQNIGAFVEVGYGISVANVGVSFKF